MLRRHLVPFEADRATHPGSTQSAITSRILGEILLMVVLGEVIIIKRQNFGGDRAVTRVAQFDLVRGERATSFGLLS